MSIFNKLLFCGLVSTFFFLFNTDRVFAGISGVTVSPNSHIFEDTVITTEDQNGPNDIDIFMVKHPKTLEGIVSATKTYYVDIYDPNEKDAFYNPYANDRAVQFTNNDSNSWSIGLGFKPIKTGNQSGTIYIRVATDNKMQNIVERVPIKLSGKGLPNKPTLSYGPNQLYFGNLEIDKTIIKEVKIENLTPTIYFLSIRCTSKHDSFTAQLEGKSFNSCTNDSDMSIDPGNAKTLFISFNPKEEKNYLEDIVFSTNDTDRSTFKIRVSGTGIKTVEEKTEESSDINLAIGGIPTQGEELTSRSEDNVDEKIVAESTQASEDKEQSKKPESEGIAYSAEDQNFDKTTLEKDKTLDTRYQIPNTREGEGGEKPQTSDKPEKNKARGYLALILLVGLVSAGPLVSKKLVE